MDETVPLRDDENDASREASFEGINHDAPSGRHHDSMDEADVPDQSNLSIYDIPSSISPQSFGHGEHENPSTDCNILHDLNGPEPTVLPPERAPVPITNESYENFQLIQNGVITHMDDAGAPAPVPVSICCDEKNTKKDANKLEMSTDVDGDADASTSMIQIHSDAEEKSGENVAAAAATENRHDLLLENQDYLHQTQIPRTLVGRIESLNISVPDIQIDAGLPRPPIAALSQSAPNDLVRIIGERHPQAPHSDNSHQDEDEVIIIPEAFRVDEAMNIQVAERIQHDESGVISSIKRSVCVLSLVMAVVVITLVIVLLVIIKGGNGTDDTDELVETIPDNSLSPLPSSQSSFIPSFRPTESVRESIQENALERNMTFDTMAPDDHRVLALDWMTLKDLSKLDVTAPNLHQRYILALFAFSVGGDISWLELSAQNECDWPGITCEHQGNITKLELGQFFDVIPFCTIIVSCCSPHSCVIL